MKQNDMPLVSVMIPYYNCGKYIAETLESVNQQNYPYLETIVVDDGSDVSESAQLDSILHNYPHIRLIRQKNQGLSAARNTAAQAAKGIYYLFLDADDIILPDYISECVAVLSCDSNCKLVYPQAEFFDARTGLWNLPPYENVSTLLKGNHIPAIAMHRSKDFHELGGFDPLLKSHEDWDLWIRMLAKGGRAKLINRVLFRYRKRTDHTSLTDQLAHKTNALAESWQRVYIKHSDLFIEYGLSYYELIDIRNKYFKKRSSAGLKKWLNRLKNKKTD